MNDKISFQSNIRLVSSNNFKKFCGANFKTVDYPWTVNQSVVAPKALTTGVFDCTALGINDGKNVLFMHICPTEPRNMDWANIERFIVASLTEHLDMNCLQGLILGSKPYKNSTKLFEFLENILKKLNIEYSKFKGGDYTNHLAYDSIKDEWIIGNPLLEFSKKLFGTPMGATLKMFEDVKIAEVDELIW